ncbi:MAG: winged helix-turn-helix domain-containing protein [Methanocellales archaeon]
MEDIESKEESKKLLILPLGEQSKKLTQVISNETAMKILELLAESSLSTSQISELLNLPITTVQYNIDNLMNIGLIKIDRVKYSEKGREVKIYAPRQKLIVLVPEKTDSSNVLDILKKYIALLFFALVSASAIEFLIQSTQSIALAPARENAVKGFASAPQDIWSHVSLWFLVGCLLVISILAGYEFISKRRQ